MITKKELLELVDAVFEDLASIDSGIKNGNLTEEMKKDYLFDLETLKRELSLFNLNTLTREFKRVVEAKERIFPKGHAGEIQLRIFSDEIVLTCDHTEESICIPRYNFEQMIDYYQTHVTLEKEAVE